RRVHLRGAERPLGSDGGPPGATAEPPAGAGHQRAAGQADPGEQRRNHLLGPGRAAPARRRGRGAGPAEARTGVGRRGGEGGLVPAWLPVREGWKDRLRVKLADITDDGQRKALSQVVETGLARRQDWFDLLSIPLELNLFRNLGPVLGVRVGLMLGAGLVVYG